MRCRFDRNRKAADMPDSLTPEFEEFRTLVLDAGKEEQLLRYLAEYTDPGLYTGAHFHELIYAGPSHPDRFDIADVTAPSLLSVTIHKTATQTLLRDQGFRAELEAYLAREPDRDLGQLTDAEMKKLESDEGLNPAWAKIKSIDDVGRTRTAKLLARKRPRLIPIWDSVIRRVLGLKSTRTYWTTFHTALTADNRALDQRLGVLAEKAGVSERYSRLRVLDILAWKYGRDEKNFKPDILTEQDPEQDES